ncbi:MAG: hypothetical protein KAI28_10750 [Sphingomonadales bacterium]|nr:hypothetical protein [Sphingomonadales bacterium]
MFSKFRLLPLLMLVAMIVFVFKANGVADGVSEIVKAANAAQDVENKPAQEQPQADVPPEVEEIKPARGLDPLMMSKSELDLLQSLSTRRQELEDWASQLIMRERLLNATEKRIDTKIARLESIEAQVKVLVAGHEERENVQLDSIVKVYSSMKPKAAAPIFEKLDMDIQVQVATRMKEAKMGLILAAMSEEAAMLLTTELATRAKMPPIDG